MDEVIYDDVPPWPVDADGLGSSLTRQSTIALGTLASAWTSREPSPGSAEFAANQPGDSNRDGSFNQLDIVQVLQSGKYLSGNPATFAEGDWNEDGLFDQRDIVTVLQDGSFNPHTNAAKDTDPFDVVFAAL